MDAACRQARETGQLGPTRQGQWMHKERGGPLPVRRQASTRDALGSGRGEPVIVQDETAPMRV